MTAERTFPYTSGKFLIADPDSTQNGNDRFLAWTSAAGGDGLWGILEFLPGSDTPPLLQLKHPNIAEIHETGQLEGRPFAFREWVRGIGLGDIFEITKKTAQAIPPIITLEIFLGLARALQHAHRWKNPASGMPQPIIHGRLNPENIRITFDGQVKVMGYGCIENQTPASEHPEWLSPEHLRGEALCPETDLFTLGVILYESLTGTPAYTGDSETIITERVRHSDAFRPNFEVPGMQGAYREIIETCLEPNPEHRTLSADWLVSTFRRLHSIERGRNPDMTLALYVCRLFPDQHAQDEARFTNLLRSTETRRAVQTHDLVDDKPTGEIRSGSGAAVIDLDTRVHSVELELKTLSSSLNPGGDFRELRKKTEPLPPPSKIEPEPEPAPAPLPAPPLKSAKTPNIVIPAPPPSIQIVGQAEPTEPSLKSKMASWVQSVEREESSIFQRIGWAIAALVLAAGVPTSLWLAGRSTATKPPPITTAPSSRPILKLTILPEGGAPTRVFSGKKQLQIGARGELEISPDPNPGPNNDLRLKIMKPGFRTLTVNSAASNRIVLEPIRSGRLSFQAPPGTGVTLIGQKYRWTLEAPFQRLPVPPGTWRLYFRTPNSTVNGVRSFKIKAGQNLRLK